MVLKPKTTVLNIAVPSLLFTMPACDISSVASAIEPALQDAVKAAVRAEASDPVAFIAHFLAQRSTNKAQAPAATCSGEQANLPFASSQEGLPEPAAAGKRIGETTSADPAPPGREGAWTAASWVATLNDVNESIASCLLGDDRPCDDLAALRALGAAAHSASMLEERLRAAGVVEAMAKTLLPALHQLARAEAATGAELHSKYAQDGEAFTLQYSDLSTFFGGLEAKIGPPRPYVRKAMEEEHTASSDSHDEFTTGATEIVPALCSAVLRPRCLACL